MVVVPVCGRVGGGVCARSGAFLSDQMVRRFVWIKRIGFSIGRYGVVGRNRIAGGPQGLQLDNYSTITILHACIFVRAESSYQFVGEFLSFLRVAAEERAGGDGDDEIERGSAVRGGEEEVEDGDGGRVDSNTGADSVADRRRSLPGRVRVERENAWKKTSWRHSLKGKTHSLTHSLSFFC
ncbi:hypothetical protein LWI28_024390 [Acer negundo]|uniref:Uncharacterized protein n=1 Tax=Acer negundo TaxID=4023 RepID=A0AAD5IGZ8_ACENE|nr:hypothetical protein LWI28_024390 [Acer negundo]